ncbi:glycosyltransferase family protein 64 C3 [Quillaja saponaria]|uniref:Glycosyltransferase family protein 64 C3 n=1 Tax=Quillaja saponaria TaxID=32244 RepID=A0AAD7LXH4_QUISA|nr:glycosyltransferase family protein 64 C3 [Quillaja saponaria]
MNSPVETIVTLSLLLIFPRLLVLSMRTLSADPCDSTAQRDRRTLRSDQITVLLNGYSESRIPLIQSISATYTASPLVSSVLVLWGNPSTPHNILTQLAHNLSISSFGAASISIVRQPSSSLNARFLPRSYIKTHAVLICDDDVEVDPRSFEFAFWIWSSNRDRLIGFFARSHDIDLSRKEWIYTVHPDKYSIILTKFMILDSDYLYKYSCEGGPGMIEMRRTVDLMRNCEDILMNFVIANETNAGPILVGAKRVRDYGDARNDHGDGDGDGDGDDNGRIGLKGEEQSMKVSEVGLSSRRKEHRKRRGECIRKFHSLLGKMPLRYSYGKVVNSVGEQGLCEKGGKLVFCDQ